MPRHVLACQQTGAGFFTPLEGPLVAAGLMAIALWERTPLEGQKSSNGVYFLLH